MAPRVLGICGERLFIFLGIWRSTDNYFRGAGEHAHSFVDLGSPVKKQKEKINKEKNSILFDFFFKFLLLFFCIFFLKSADQIYTYMMKLKLNKCIGAKSFA